MSDMTVEEAKEILEDLVDGNKTVFFTTIHLWDKEMRAIYGILAEYNKLTQQRQKLIEKLDEYILHNSRQVDDFREQIKLCKKSEPEYHDFIQEAILHGKLAMYAQEIKDFMEEQLEESES